MKVIITSDTHMPKRGSVLPSRLTEACRTADLILHAGDWSTLEAYEQLSALAHVKGVYGNIDNEDIKSRFPDRQIIDINGFRIGLVHGHGDKKTTEKRAVETFEDENADIIVFGHSHIPVIRYTGKTLLLNPGSPTDKRRLPYYSFIILHLDTEIRPELVLFAGKE